VRGQIAPHIVQNPAQFVAHLGLVLALDAHIHQIGFDLRQQSGARNGPQGARLNVIS
jgi:hypothetical protein